MAPTCLARQIASRESPQEWLVRLGINVATFCDMWSRKQPALMPFGHIIFLNWKVLPLRGSPPPTLHPYRTACGIDYLVK